MILLKYVGLIGLLFSEVKIVVFVIMECCDWIGK